MSWRARRCITASSSGFNISCCDKVRWRARLVARVDQLADEPHDLRPVAALQVPRMNREGRNAAMEGVRQPAYAVTDVAEPSPASAVPGEGGEGHGRACHRIEGEEAEDMVEAERPHRGAVQLAALPPRGEEAARFR